MAGFPVDVRQRATEIASHEADHVVFLQAALASLGGALICHFHNTSFHVDRPSH